MSYDIKNHPLTIDKNLFKQSNINQMFDKIKMILVMKTSILNNRISRLKNDCKGIETHLKTKPEKVFS